MINIRELVSRNKTRVIDLVFKLREKQSIINKLSNGWSKASHLLDKIKIYKDLNRAELNLEVQQQLRQIIQENIVKRLWNLQFFNYEWSEL